MSLKKWELNKINSDLINKLAQECNINILTAVILSSRGHTTYSQVASFLSDEDELSDPFDIKDMDKAVERINQAVDEGELITIYGDYDCDGITSTSILYIYLNSIGAAVTYYIPSREKEGYGLNKNALKTLHEQGTTLVVTVDNGISAIAEVDYANEIGLDIIITDHHQPGDVLPNALAVVDPHRKDDTSSFKSLAGVGVAFKLIAGLEDGEYHTAIEQFSNIVAIGTIADIVELEGENRTIVRYGLENIKTNENYGINALLEVSNIDAQKIDSTKIAFGIAPRINASGRIGDPKEAVKLLISEDPDQAIELAENLNQLNIDRKDIESKIMENIEDLISKNPKLLDKRVLVLKGEDWHHGVIGIVCSKILDKYGKPTFIMSLEDGVLRGSARSLGDFHLFNALTYCKDYLDRFGGHKLAAGYSILEDNYDDFVNKIEEYALKNHDIMPSLEIKIDAKLNTVPTVEEVTNLSYLEPFGCSNETPVFLLTNCTITNIKSLKEDKHQKLTFLLQDGATQDGMLFFTSTNNLIYKIGDKVDIIVNAELNEFRGDISVSMIIKDLRFSGFNQRQFFTAREYFNKIMRDEEVGEKVAKIAIPQREDINLIYKYLRDNKGSSLDVEALFLKLNIADMNYCKYRVILQVLHQAKLIKINPSLRGIEYIKPTQKVDLESTNLMKFLKNQ